MDITKSSNPVFGKNIFSQSAINTEDGVMTVNGTINKTGLMLLIVIFAATFTWRKFFGAIDPATPGVMPGVAFLVGSGRKLRPVVVHTDSRFRYAALLRYCTDYAFGFL